MAEPTNFLYEHAWGPVYGWFSVKGLYRLELPRQDTPVERRSILHSSVNDGRVWRLNAALERYFSGQHETFGDIALDIDDATPFQREVWETARTIGWGQTATYGSLAEAMGKPKSSSRAVGHALGQNRIAILIPCHRFLASNGNLVGFAAGLEWKQELIRLEGGLLA
ncbi:MAG: methylated-DNA--[protein]-cysteine S-methyltransferase [Candidatus Hydrogenedentes bacterium]|nr:methylated-DNA--[protein]-cysteine S-methyltransferase [Candidatus Hydrogenedentota bacterium]